MSHIKNVNYLNYSFFVTVVALLISLFFLLSVNYVDIIPIEVYPVLIFFLILVGLLYKEKISKVITFLILISFLVKSMYSYVIYKTITSPFPDSFNYLSNLEIVRQSNLSVESLTSIVGSLHFGYYYFMYIISFIFNTNYSLYVANIFLFSFSSLMFYKLLKSDFGESISKITIILFLCSFNMFLFTSNILKDSLVLFLMILSLYIYKQKKYKVLVLIPAFFLVTVRIYAGASIILAIVFDYLVFGKLTKKQKVKGVSSAIITSIVLLNLPFATNYLEKINSFLAESSVVELVVYPLVSLVKFYFSPLFWNLIAAPNVYLITFIDSFLALIFSFAVLLFIIKFFKYKDLRSKMYLYVIPIFVHALALGIEYGGDSTRQRVGVYGFIILTFIIGLLYKKHSYKKEVQR
ncbi:hypothetical protein [Salimicrobium album]|uniref:Dolichyl-phosphate-mannose-protein mannosyltransferase n=1 Tax=Salimicrobium album TaxID=50717 RepID=A0A1H3EKG7_9BACI|nr:hypothetical protein [Salimicrobium album]SDX79097.1 hypothetical protein SAMN04488081_1262 [Salimicrobium album]